MFAIAGPDIQAHNSVFLSGSNQDPGIFRGDGGIVSGNHFVLSNWSGLGIQDSRNVIFEEDPADDSQTPLTQKATFHSIDFWTAVDNALVSVLRPDGTVQ
jgi:hypothetical protein